MEYLLSLLFTLSFWALIIMIWLLAWCFLCVLPANTCSSVSTYFQWLIGRCSLVYGASIMQDKNLNEYDPAGSNTSKLLTCSHRLCTQQENCKSSAQSCTYSVQYYSPDTSSSGQLVEDVLHLTSSSNNSPNVKTSIIFGYALLT